MIFQATKHPQLRRRFFFPLQCLSFLEFSASAAENLNSNKSTLLLECETGSSSQSFNKNTSLPSISPEETEYSPSTGWALLKPDRLHAQYYW